MLKEVDFSKGVRGKHYGRVRIIVPVEEKPKDDAPGKLRRSLEADLRKLGVFDKLDEDERSALRESWNRKIEKALAD